MRQVKGRRQTGQEQHGLAAGKGAVAFRPKAATPKRNPLTNHKHCFFSVAVT